MRVYYPVWSYVLSFVGCLVLFILLSLVMHSPLPLQIAGIVALLRMLPMIVANPRVIITPDNKFTYQTLLSKKVTVDLNQLTSCSYFLGMARTRGSVPMLIFRLEDATGSVFFLPAHWWFRGRKIYALIRDAVRTNNVLVDDKTARKLDI